MDVVDTPKKEIRDMNVMELIERISETTKIAALNLWGTNREHTNIAINECAQEMRDIRSVADKCKLQDAIENISVAFRVMEALTEISKIKTVKDIVSEMLDNDESTSLTDVSDSDDDVIFYISDSD